MDPLNNEHLLRSTSQCIIEPFEDVDEKVINA